MHVQLLLDNGRLRLQQIDPAELSAGEFTHAIRREVRSNKVRVLVIDSLNGYLQAMPDQRFLLAQMHELLTYLGQYGVATFLVMGQAGTIRELKFGPQGIEIGEALRQFQGILSGEPTFTGAAEQLLTEREDLRRQSDELQKQSFELRRLKERAERTARTMEGLARLVEENPDPALRVAPDGRIHYRNPASFQLDRRWNGSDKQKVPPAVQEIVAAAYAQMKVLRGEVTFGERTCSLTVAPAPARAHAVNVFVRDITARQQAEEARRDLNITLEGRVAERTAELRRRTRQLQKLTLEMSEAEDRERERLAHILHDDLQQQLAAAKFHLSIVKSHIKHDASAREITGRVDEMLRDAIAKSRSLSYELSPAVLRGDDFAEIFQWLANEMEAKHGLRVRVQGWAQASSGPVKALLYRTAQAAGSSSSCRTERGR